MTDSDLATLRSVAPGIAWARSRDGGADGRAGTLRLWVTREKPYSEPRGGWMVQILTAGHFELDRRIAKTIPVAMAKALRWATAEVRQMAQAVEVMRSDVAVIGKGGDNA